MSNPMVQRIKSEVDANPECGMSLAQIAENIGISVYYMSHLFKRHTGMTVVEYRTMRRMERAGRLLSETSMSVTEIAFACGFSSQGYFSERFAKMFGMSPTKFRATRNK